MSEEDIYKIQMARIIETKKYVKLTRKGNYTHDENYTGKQDTRPTKDEYKSNNHNTVTVLHTGRNLTKNEFVLKNCNFQKTIR